MKDWICMLLTNNEKEKVIQKLIDFLEHLKSLKPLRDAGIGALSAKVRLLGSLPHHMSGPAG
jgi:hypothetical protein